ncbi:sensor histidine kinase [Yunchengibacter salinarum]|uniref:sensor histidine kinase n=1 Tax=Yunchengibacter salinarum TaxID=3133399 RepID=UPI0035B5D2B0
MPQSPADPPMGLKADALREQAEYDNGLGFRPRRGQSRGTGPDRDSRPGRGMMAGLFSNRDRTFWTLQAIGWSGYALVRMFHAMTVGWHPLDYYPLVLFAMVFGFLLSTLMRYLYRPLRDRPMLAVLPLVLLVSGSLGLLFSSVEVAMAPRLIDEFEPARGLERFGNAMFEATALFAWSSIYFGYHYYRGYQRQQKQLLKATAMAHQAQLSMLRYQLNPHFLFNTLNAISTLVLEGASSEANRMIAKLSSFLRYTLVNQASHKISLEQELYALGLYLDIEKVRFEDRLKIVYDIDERARDALIPSLILQPLIENAIKYALAPSIEGGTLTIRAERRGPRLRLAVCDDGPGMTNPDAPVSRSGSGVGLANTRTRMEELYGADQAMTIANRQTGGLCVTLDLPFEKDQGKAT